MREDEARAIWARQAEVRVDFERLEAVARQLGDVWTGIHWDDGDIVVLVTDPERVRERLWAAVDHPDRVRIERARYSRAYLDEVYEAVRGELRTGVEQRWTSHGPGQEAVRLSLHATEDGLAQQLHERFGDAIEITLGRHRFPLGTAPAHPAPPGPVPTLDVPGLVVTAELDRARVSAGERFRGSLRFRNTGPGRIRLWVDAPATAVLLDPEGRAVGGWTGFIAGLERGVDLAPGQENSGVGFLGGSDAASPEHGAVLRPGRYLLVVPVRVTVEGELGSHGTLVTEPLRITLE